MHVRKPARYGKKELFMTGSSVSDEFGKYRNAEFAVKLFRTSCTVHIPDRAPAGINRHRALADRLTSTMMKATPPL
jgi:hypothetical protein